MRLQQFTCISQLVSDGEDLSPHLDLSREVFEVMFLSGPTLGLPMAP